MKLLVILSQCLEKNERDLQRSQFSEDTKALSNTVHLNLKIVVEQSTDDIDTKHE